MSQQLFLGYGGGGGSSVLVEDDFTGALNTVLLGRTPDVAGSAYVYVDTSGWFTSNNTNGPKLNGSGAAVMGTNDQALSWNQVIPGAMTFNTNMTMTDVTNAGSGITYSIIVLFTRWDVAAGSGASPTGEIVYMDGAWTSGGGSWSWAVTFFYETVIAGAAGEFVNIGTSANLASGATPPSSTPATFDVQLVYTNTEIGFYINGAQVGSNKTRDVNVPVNDEVGSVTPWFGGTTGTAARSVIRFNDILIEG